MARWLFKQEPEAYSFADLVRDKSTLWDGVANALAKKHLAAVKAGDRVLFYETGKIKAVVGEMKVIATEEGVVVEPVAALAHPVGLARIKAEVEFAEWELVRLPRLSVMPVTMAIWRHVVQLSKVDG